MFLDSAVLSDVEAAAKLGYVNGITMNPVLLARAKATSPLSHLEAILGRFSLGPVLYQPCTTDPHDVEAEARKAASYAPGQVGIKLLACQPYFEVARKLTADDIPCAMTAVYSPAQAVLAHDAGCRWVIPYVDRSQRLLTDGSGMVRAIRSVLTAKTSRVSLLAASIKSAGQAMQTIIDGADEVSVSLDVLQELAEHPLTTSAAEEFAKAATDFS